MLGAGRELNWRLDPLEAVARWRLDRPLLALHSGRYDPRWARWSLLTSPEAWYRFTGDERTDGRSELVGQPPVDPARLVHRPFADLRQLLAGGSGLWVGYIGYDIARWIETLPSNAERDRDWPVIELGYCPGWLLFDHANHNWHACGSWSAADVDGLLDDAAHDFEPPRTGPATSVFTQQSYEQAVARVIEYIAAGDIFQANLSQRLTAGTEPTTIASRRALFVRLARTSPAWYGALLELPDGPRGTQRAIASTSPELFLQVTSTGQVITRPIKGTRPANVPPEQLERSEKDAAELNMIVDLMRNDLGRVCTYGSVRVTQPRTIESHPTVHHGVATVEGQLHESRDLVHLLRATLPGGSVTGAPKVRAMEIIDELEPVRRGPYTGCIGFLSRDHGARLNIAIRTMLIEQPADSDRTRIDFSVGGGIVSDSDPAAEYRETLDKAEAILRTLGLSNQNWK